ncbi:MAG: c-type cytochrome [Burkholderiales bacterium]|nr:c-type cytochrome [Burkholderiales bacterium]
MKGIKVNFFVKTLCLCLCWPLFALAQTSASASADGKTPVWNELKGEKLEALQLKGDVTRGAEAFQPCQGCHRRGAVGSASGLYPRLAGQHATVLVEQITDIRAGKRVNPTMAPFSDEHVLTTQEIADIAAYLQSLPPKTLPEAKGPGSALERGEKLYAKDCAVCHGNRGEGDAKKFMPLVAGQHYQYLLREMALIRDGKRGNANPDMVKVISAYGNADLEAVADYISRLLAP